jgi:hypothetical protein
MHVRHPDRLVQPLRNSPPAVLHLARKVHLNFERYRVLAARELGGVRELGPGDEDAMDWGLDDDPSDYSPRCRAGGSSAEPPGGGAAPQAARRGRGRACIIAAHSSRRSSPR